MKKTIKYYTYKLTKNHSIAFSIISGIVLSLAVITLLHCYAMKTNDIDLQISTTVPQLENSINPSDFTNHSSACDSIDKPISNDTINTISNLHN